MNEIRYNWLMGTIRDISAQHSLLFCDNTSSQQDAEKTPEHILKTVFGYDEFRPLQREVIQNVLDGRDTLAVMPTGGGKSLCYEIPAMLLPGLTVVVSPLIALMQDQVSQLEAVGIPAVFLNSSLDWAAYSESYERIRHGAIKLLYVSPEGLRTERIQTLLHNGQLSVSCITIDEAHCVSEWGHDFRPDYMEIASVREQFPHAVCLALTATATKTVRSDIIAQLHLENPAVLVSSFNRPNLFLDVQIKRNASEQVSAFLAEHRSESGIIYCASRKQVDELTKQLKADHISATNYHAGLSEEERSAHQKDFITDAVHVMVATVAFGMGINKPDVRFVVHYDLPKSIEQYYQEIGRAGRDGLPAHALLLYSLSDVHKIRYFFTEKNDPETAEKLLQGILHYAGSRTCRRTQLLSYFGEQYENTADAADCCCDICAKGPVALHDFTIPTQKFLSCMVRTKERYGAAYIIDILRGARSKRIGENHHDKLSTYGIGTELSKESWFALSATLIEAGYIQKSMEYSVLSLTALGRDALRDRQSIFLPLDLSDSSPAAWDGKKAGRSKFGAGSFYANKTYDRDERSERVVAALKGWRRKMADELNVPPYIIFGDKTLYDIAARKPQSQQELRACYGIGEAKAERFGSSILRVTEDACTEAAE